MALPREILFIDPAVADLGTLLESLRSGVEAIVLDIARPAAGQIAAALAGRHRLSALHLIAHGAPGRVSFAAVPLLNRWVVSRREHGALTLDDLCEIAELRDVQLDGGDMAEGARECLGLAEWEVAKRSMAKKGKEEQPEQVVTLPTKPVKPTMRRVTTIDATTKSLAPILAKNERGLSMLQDELTGLRE